MSLGLGNHGSTVTYGTSLEEASIRELQPPHVLKSSNKISNAKMTTLQKHLSGECHPCVAFAIRAAGCYKGDSCTHCHFCTAEEAKERRRVIQMEAKVKKKQAKLEMDPRESKGNQSTFWL
ncbi:unnamed protein product [Cladocopium goreaui]|uniref:C3H1-type domain-containing protein n=1 Tax=Cladocopium goreaui TaxID=2562237 RepID=A0A9P1DU98_9DINO|nr:unnamed protein product [Cladocopium goreaui]|mmetsp:Transcript_57951/g.126670  ORF Transcript_57951/g.126670 Transcript_57951/m.126670 type:complete len:121 (+) Transcript_57951:60-422(+)